MKAKSSFILLATIVVLALIIPNDRGRRRAAYEVRLMSLLESTNGDPILLERSAHDFGVFHYDLIYFNDELSYLICMEDPRYIEESQYIALGKDGRLIAISFKKARELLSNNSNQVKSVRYPPRDRLKRSETGT